MKCFYHSADLDGHCSGAIIKSKFPKCEMIGINYGHAFPWESISKKEQVFMVDFGLQPFSDMHRLKESCSVLHWIDHHKTAIDDAETESFFTPGITEIGRAGCELTWEYVYPNKNVPYGVQLLGLYDVWDHSNKDTLNFQYGMRQYKNTLPENTKLWSKVFNKRLQFMNETLLTGEVILNYEKSQNKKCCDAYHFETKINGLNGVCINKGFTNSKIFDSVFDEEKHDIMITFCRIGSPINLWTVSLYTTKENVDCGTIAKSFGGGGHHNASGFQCKELPFNI